jgi:hypothetical protein
MSDDQGSLKAGFGTINLSGPFLPPEVLIGEEGVTNFVVSLHELLGAGQLDDFWWELLHRNRDPVEQVSRPSDGARNCWQVVTNGRIGLVILIVPLYLVNLSAIIGEQELILGIQGSGQVLPVEDGLKLPEQLQGFIDAH